MIPLPQSPQRTAFLVVVGLLVALGVWVASGFLAALVWACVIAIAIDPVNLRLRRTALGRVRAVPALLLTLLTALVIMVPVGLALAEAVREARELAIWFAAARTNGLPVPDWVAHLPFGSQMAADWWREHLSTPDAAAAQWDIIRHQSWITHPQRLARLIVRRAIVFSFTLITLFFLLRDRDAILAQLRTAGERLLGPAGERIGVQAVRSVRGVIDGLVLVGIVEGAIMAVVYLGFGVPRPLLFGAVTAVAAMIPFASTLVFVGAGLLLVSKGSIVSAIAVVAIGLVLVEIAGHFVRPALIGGATQLPFIWVLIGILGGVETMGLIGLFVGPALMAVLILLWREMVSDPPA